MSEEQRDRRDGEGARDRRSDSDRKPRNASSSPRTPRGDGARGGRDTPRKHGDRPYRNDRPQGERRSYGDRDRAQGDRSQSDRPYRNDRAQGDRPYRNDRAQGERRYRNDRPQGDRPYRNDRAQGERPYRNDRPQGERRPYGNRDRPQGDRPYRNDRPQGDRPYRNDRPQGDRPYRNDRPQGERPYRNDRPQGDRPYRNDGPQGERRPYGNRDRTQGDRPYRNDRPQGERRPYGNRDRTQGDRPYRDDRAQSERRPYNDRDRSRGDRDRSRGDGGSFRDRPRGGSERPYNEYAPVRERIPEPPLPDEITARDLHPSARNELKTLSKENAEQTARHLAMVAQLVDDEPERAHEHALAASRRAGRIAVVRSTLAITAYGIGDFALALRELRTYRRISGKDDMIALIVDSERGVGRPDRALEEGRSVDQSVLDPDVRVALAIAMSGARLDRGETELALGELEIPELDPDRAFEWSPALFSARAAVLEDLGRTEEAAFWTERAEVAASALGLDGQFDEMIVEDGLIEDEDGDLDDGHDEHDEVRGVEPDPEPQPASESDDETEA